MKNLYYYTKLSYKIEIVEDEDEGGYVLSIPRLQGCMTTAETIEDGLTQLLDAKKEWIKTAIDDGIPIPEPLYLVKYSGQFKLRIPKSLHKQLAVNAKNEGISMNQYCVYLLSKCANSLSH